MATTIKPLKVTRHIRFPDGSAVPAMFLSGARITNPTVDNIGTAEAALPTGSQLVLVSSTQGIWLRFGATGMAAAGADDNSRLFPAGVEVVVVPIVGGLLATHYRAVRAGADSAQLQIERIDCVNDQASA